MARAETVALYHTSRQVTAYKHVPAGTYLQRSMA